ncbi:hypothetical protein B5S28_g4296 [[Candida] boidinii]|nr:hypothetical protein B5S28_g4296 [[Candida] boidinii]OWB63666.1 hypothetical protein B5S29_g4663 [[Candida] boidinii]OWB73033.1 hypothetical protein B5S31_g2765 [[Candida] boidinii]
MSQLSSPGATIKSSVINLINTIIGAGLLAIPYSFKTDGVLLGVLILLFSGISSSFGLYLQGVSSKFLKKGDANFFTICSITYPSLSVLFDIAIAIQCFGVGLSYIILTGDLMPIVLPFGDYSKEQLRLIYILLSVFIVVPLCYLKNLDSLKYTSIIALLAILYLTLFVYSMFFYSLFNDFQNIPIDKRGKVNWIANEGFNKIFSTFSIGIFAFTGHQNMYSIINELNKKFSNLIQISKIILISMGLSFFLFLTVGLFGYLTYGNTINGNIILVYDDDLIPVKLGRILLVLMVLLSYPLMFHPARISFNNIIHWVSVTFFKYDFTKDIEIENESSDTIVNETSPLIRSGEDSDDNNEDDDTKFEQVGKALPLPEKRFLILTTLMLILSYFVAISLKSFELVLALVGATGSTAISFILPGLFGYKLLNTHNEFLKSCLDKNVTIDEIENENENENGEHQNDHSINIYNYEMKILNSKYLKIASLLLSIWGIIAMFICLYATLFT